MTAAELMHHNFDEIFIELDPVKREAMFLSVRAVAFRETNRTKTRQW